MLLAASRFDADLEGWTVSGGSNVVGPWHSVDGGNPGGMALARSDTRFWWSAPPKILAALAGNRGGRLAYDLRINQLSGFEVVTDDIY